MVGSFEAVIDSSGIVFDNPRPSAASFIQQPVGKKKSRTNTYTFYQGE